MQTLPVWTTARGARRGLRLFLTIGFIAVGVCFSPAATHIPRALNPAANRFLLHAKGLLGGVHRGRYPRVGNAGVSGLCAAQSSGAEPYWWEQKGGLPFDCTGCGKCCKVKGDVWVSPRDMDRMSTHLKLSLDEFSEKYARRRVAGWVQLKDRGEGDDACVFLGADDKTCGIYEARPLQCSVYPFFPRLLSTPEAWNGEVVAPDAAEAGRKWSPESGGCEGMAEVKGVRFNQKKGKWVFKDGKDGQGGSSVPQVSAEAIRKQLEEYENYFLDFPHEFLLLNNKKRGKAEAISSGVNEILQDDGLTSALGEATERPELFYDQLFAISNMVKKEIAQSKLEEKELEQGIGEGQVDDVAVGREGNKASNKGRRKISDKAGGDKAGGGVTVRRVTVGGYTSGELVGSREGELSASEERVAKLLMAWAERHVIRLGLCPFAPNAMDTGKVRIRVCTGVSDEQRAREIFLEEAKLIIDTPEEDLPTTLVAFPDLHMDDFLAWNDFTEDIEDLLDEEGGWAEVGDEVLIAAFHPAFEFGGLSKEEQVLHFEKRAPVPVINLLRTAAIDRGIERGVTAERIAGDNEESLLQSGIEDVADVYHSLGEGM